MQKLHKIILHDIVLLHIMVGALKIYGGLRSSRDRFERKHINPFPDKS